MVTSRALPSSPRTAGVMPENNESPRSLLGIVVGMIAALLLVPWPGAGVTLTPSRGVETGQRASDGDPDGAPPAAGAPVPGMLDRPLLEYLGIRVDQRRDRDQFRDAIVAGLRDDKTRKQTIDLTAIVMCVADPVSSSSGYRTDLQLETLQKSVAEDGWIPDRWWLPWAGDDGKPKRSAGVPGVMLFRRHGAAKTGGENTATGKTTTGRTRGLLVVYLVGELMTSGLDRPAFATAVERATTLMEAAELAAGPVTATPAEHSAAATLREPAHRTIPILGPVFSGSTDSLALGLREHLERLGAQPNRPGLVVVNFSAAKFDGGRFENLLGSGPVAYASTITSFKEQQQKLLAYAREMGQRRIAWLQEAGTGLSVRSVRDSADYDVYVFPAGIAQVRDAYASASAAGRTTPLTSPTDRTLLRFPADAQTTAVDLLPRFSPGMQGPYTELSLRHLLLDIARDDFDAVGITATDHRDRLFLVQQLRQHAPEVQILLVGGDLAFDHPAYRQAMLGTLVASSYPPFTAHHLWPSRVADRESRLALPTQASYGLVNAIALGLDMAARPLEEFAGAGGPLLSYGPKKPLAALRHYDAPVSAAESPGEVRPPVWISSIGYQGAWPLRWAPVRADAEAGITAIGQPAVVAASGSAAEQDRRIELSGLQRNPMPLSQLVALLLVLSLLATLAVRGGFSAVGRGGGGRVPGDWAATDEWIRALGDWWQKPGTPAGRSWRLGGPLAVMLAALWVPATAVAAVALAGLIAGDQPAWDGSLTGIGRWSTIWWLAATWLLAPWRIPRAVRLMFIAGAVAGCLLGGDPPWLLATTILAATASLHLLACLFRVGWQAGSRGEVGMVTDYWLTMAAAIATIGLLLAIARGCGDVATRLPWLLTAAWVFNGISPLLPLTASGLALAVLWYAELVRSWRADEAPVASSLGRRERDDAADEREQSTIRYPLLGRHSREWLGTQLRWNLAQGTLAPPPTPIGLLQFIFLVATAVWLAVLSCKLTPLYPDRLSHPAAVTLLMAAFFSWALLLVRTQALVGLLFDTLHRFRSEMDAPGSPLKKAFGELHRPADVLLGRMLYGRHLPRATLDDVTAVFPGEERSDPEVEKLFAARRRAIGMKRFVRSLGGQVRWLIAGLAVGAAFLFVAATSLPCQPRSGLMLTSTLSFVAFAWLSVRTLLRIERDPVLSLIANSTSGRVTWDMQTLVKVALPVGVPVLLILGQAFPEAWQWLGALVEGLRGS